GHASSTPCENSCTRSGCLCSFSPSGQMKKPPRLKPRTVYLMANGDLRASANQKCWPEQARVEEIVTRALQAEGWRSVRAHPYDKARGHGFIDSQKMGLEVFRALDAEAPLVIVESVWQYSQHLLAGLASHRGPILTVANWSGTWPGLVGLLNLNASMTKAGIKYSSLWSEDFGDPFFIKGLRHWLKYGRLAHDTSHVHSYGTVHVPRLDAKVGSQFAR